MLSEDIQDERSPVKYTHVRDALQIPELRRRELVIDENQCELEFFLECLKFLELAGAKVVGLIRVFQSLEKFADDVDICRLRQELEFFERRVDIPAVVLPINGNENCAFFW